MLRAHHLTQHAWAVGGQNAQQAIISVLLQTAFEEGLDIGNIDVFDLPKDDTGTHLVSATRVLPALYSASYVSLPTQTWLLVAVNCMWRRVLLAGCRALIALSSVYMFPSSCSFICTPAGAGGPTNQPLSHTTNNGLSVFMYYFTTFQYSYSKFKVSIG